MHYLLYPCFAVSAAFYGHRAYVNYHNYRAPVSYGRHYEAPRHIEMPRHFEAPRHFEMPRHFAPVNRNSNRR